MVYQVSLTVTNGVAQLSGELNFFTVLSIREDGLQYVQQTEKPIFDFSATSKADSAGVALMIEWWRRATRAKKKIAFEKLTPSLISLIRVSNLEEVFGTL